MRARTNPAGDFVHDHPWMTFFLGLAAINAVGWTAVAVIAAATPGGASSGTSYSQQNAVPIPAGAPLNATVGSSIQLVASGAPVAGTTTNAAVLKPAPGVIGGFVAVAPGVATLSDASGATSLVTVVAATGTAGVGAGPRRPPLGMMFGVMPRRLTA